VNRTVLGILFFVLFIVMIGFAVLFPVEPYYIRTFGATSRTMGWLIATFSIAQFIFSPIWGTLSDRVGRKPVMAIGLLGYAAGMTFFGLAQSMPLLFVARTLTGVLSAATLPTAMAMIADSTTKEERAKGMGVLGAAFGLGAIFGPVVGGVLGSYWLQLPYFAAAGLSLVTFALVVAILPETLPKEGSDAGASRRLSQRLKAWNRQTMPLYLLALLVTFSLAALETAFPFLAADRFGLTERSVGYVYAVMGLVGAAVQGGLVGRVKRWIGEEKMILVGLVVSAAGMAVIAGAATAALATAGISIYAAGHGLIRPANSSLVSQRAGVGHGLAIGLLDSMDSLGRVLGPVVGGALYYARGDLPFSLGAVLNLVAFLAAIGVFMGAALRREQARG